MTMTATPASRATWYAAAFTGKQIAAALACEVDDVGVVLASFGCGEVGSVPKRLSDRSKVGLAVSMALHNQAGIALPLAAGVVRDCWQICDSVLATLAFIPTGATGAEGAREHDPFMLFSPHGSEAVALPAIDEFLDVFDGRRICWRRPRRDPRTLAGELQRLSEAVRREDTPALREKYLELLASLRSPQEHVREWIGTIGDGKFKPAPDRFVEAFPAMREGLDACADPSRFAESYGTRISVNISLAARSFKRRMLGLEVTDPFHSQTRQAMASQGVSPT